MSNATMALCPLLQVMTNHSLNNNPRTNMLVVGFHGLVSCLGILENALILWVVGFRLQRRTVASVWVLNLAMSDFLATLTLPLFTYYFYSSHSWELGNPLCKIQASIFFLNTFVSAFLLAAISLDRCLLVAKPVWCKNHRTVAGAWKVCAAGWLWAAMNTIPYFIYRSVTVRRDGRKLCYHNFALYSSHGNALWDCNMKQTATAVSKLLLAFLLPLMVIAGSYIHIGHTLRRRSRRRMQNASTPADVLMLNKDTAPTKTPPTMKSMKISLKSVSPTLSSSQAPPSPSHASQSPLSKSFTRMVAFVITAFVLCWAPYHIFCILEVMAQFSIKNLDLVEVGLPIATTFAFLNPVLNPILYAFSCPNFCVRIRQSVGAVFDGLVEEGGGLLMVTGRSIKGHMKRKSSREAGLGTPGSPNGLCVSPISESLEMR